MFRRGWQAGPPVAKGLPREERLCLQARRLEYGMAPGRPGVLVDILLNGRKYEIRTLDDSATNDDDFRIVGVNIRDYVRRPNFNAVFS